MNEIATLIIEYVSIWAPSLVAILGVVSTVLLSLSKVKSFIDDLKQDKTLKELVAETKRVSKENKELIRCNKLLIEELTRIKGYADNIQKGD